MFKKYGLTNVHLEAYSIPHAWVRGTAHARIIAPGGASADDRFRRVGAEHERARCTARWCTSMPRSPRSSKKFKGKLKGAIVIYQEPRPLSAAEADRSERGDFIIRWKSRRHPLASRDLQILMKNICEQRKSGQPS